MLESNATELCIVCTVCKALLRATPIEIAYVVERGLFEIIFYNPDLA